jgi:hypothetical protein
MRRTRAETVTFARQKIVRLAHQKSRQIGEKSRVDAIENPANESASINIEPESKCDCLSPQFLS